MWAGDLDDGTCIEGWRGVHPGLDFAMETAMSILGIERISYGVEDMEAARRFHEAWGLETIEQGKLSGTAKESS